MSCHAMSLDSPPHANFTKCVVSPREGRNREKCLNEQATNPSYASSGESRASSFDEEHLILPTNYTVKEYKWEISRT